MPWCESPWCAEERRHATTFARIIERLTASSPASDNPNRPKIVTSSEQDAIRLVISREAAEWNSSSTYAVMAAHATGDLHHLFRNVARDEIKGPSQRLCVGKPFEVAFEWGGDPRSASRCSGCRERA